MSKNTHHCRPAPTDGEVGELVRKIEEAADLHYYSQSNPHGHESTQKIRSTLREAAAALSRQSAELAEARERADKNASGWVAQIAGERGLINRLDSAEKALLSLGCKLGPEGWMRPCKYTAPDEGHLDCPMWKDGCDGSGFLPIPGAGAKEKKDE